MDQGSAKLPLARFLGLSICVLFSVFCFDALVFRSGLYHLVVLPDSTAGSVITMIQLEQNRPLSFERRVLVLGNSQQAEGFSALTASRVLAPDRINVVNAAVPGLSMRDWFYMVRDLDPNATRYNVIAIPLVDYADLDYNVLSANQLTDLSYSIGSLRLTDLPGFVSSFPAIKDRWTVFRNGLLEGLTYRADIRDFLHAPRQRIAATTDYRRHGREWQDGYSGMNKSLEGLTFNATNGEIHFPPGTPPEIETLVRSRLNLKGVSFRGDQRAFTSRWLGDIQRLYQGKDVRFVIYRMPQYPVHLRLPEPQPPDPQSVVSKFRQDPRVIVLPEDQFDWLESPPYAADGLHLNSRGRVLFSEAFGKALETALSSFHPKSN